ncbi:biotin--[acetyl-CoA-carboxylase] ligase [Campylobacter upsaliensis]|uniref:biotin--[acetyl-CoA-carboxylase] ligase n=1 Tax=Campylobacter upsaliensis TaxID=28080 RepID=UPI00004B3C75|nr:biotin--[acetyl-CoA-carboxylase] ligase [Campylobacter upsaliensis]EAI9130592.1 biotin--[acetyl-CoA-carboxylase] ligase [Campylobacter upsaliensis]EAK5116196.1 biotin--[acetyl-CoA-carboxylase] ligase [Campylobacter upsaliensis]EAK5389784.1 biotin--[acetyl-CoA-carboxylase] ligase [Campylobacter upsaliensis]EAL53256.1 biotin--acetyl-CoA-carboxylase ligase [Campylobacter upsaliensis RM3195]EGL3838400.1 biotin--[acetyl-CoA-carboxylase] ligase [Campylobacter upsaliensis]
MQIICIEKIASTQLFLCEQIRKDEIKQNTAIYALEQTSGVGSRDNAWISSRGNLHLSFCVREEDLPSDLPLASVSIYFAYLLKDLLAQKGSQIWLKWSNDLYLNDKKVGGVMSHKIGEFVVCGMGLNLKFAPQNATFCDVEIEIKELVEEFIKVLEKKFLWKQIFSKYVLEFEKSKKFSVHYEGRLYALKDALLYEDGSILLANKRVYSLR